MKTFKKILSWVFILCGVVIVVFLIGVIVYINGLKQDLTLSADTLSALNTETIVLNCNDEMLNTANLVNKKILSVDEIPDKLKSAFVSIEDKDFYNHHGINVKRMAKAMVNNITSGGIVEGASTISQQLIKNTHLSQEKTFDRKIKEILLTQDLENNYTKDEILNMYLNIIYFGEGAYGVAGASKTFFDKDVNDLTLSQCCGLAGIIKSPSKYSPIYNQENYISRRNLVLREMKEDGKITSEEYDTALNEDIGLNLNKEVSKNKLYYKAVINEAKEILGLSEKDLSTGKYKIYTYLDESIQEKLFDKMNSDEYYIANSNGVVADSLATIVDNTTGGIIAYSGRSDYNLVSFSRQPGSAIKPSLVYAPALENGLICPSSYILDEEIDIDGYSPKNVGKTYHGYVTASEAVAKSYNIAPVKLMKTMGIENCKKFAEQMGVNFSDSDQGYALALGGFTDGITLNSLVNTYMPYTNNGDYMKTSFVRKIVSSNGNVVYENNPLKTKVMGEDTAYLMTDMLIDGVKNGTSKRLSGLGYEVAGKTGTVAIPNTNNNSDAISIAYTTEHTMGVWFGNYTNRSDSFLPSTNNGGTMATSVIRDTFHDIYQVKPKPFTIPDSVQTVEIDAIAYENDHEIKLCDDSIPERYRTKILASSRHLNFPTSTTFSTLKVDNFNVTNVSDSVNISFDAVDYLKYDIVRTDEFGHETTLKSFSNVDGTQTYTDKSVNEKELYTYKIVVSSLTTSNSSESKKILTLSKAKKYNNILDSQVKKGDKLVTQSDLSWMFY